MMGELTTSGGAFKVDSLGDIYTTGSLSTDGGKVSSDGTGNLTVNGNGTFRQTIAIAQTLSSGSTISWGMNVGQVGILTLGVNATLAHPTNMQVATYIFKVQQDSTGGRLLSYDSAYKWPGGISPTLSTTANAVDIITFFCDGANMYRVSQKAFAQRI